MAWVVTEPELFATGAAVAETPPTVSALTGTGVMPNKRHAIVGRYL